MQSGWDWVGILAAAEKNGWCHKIRGSEYQVDVDWLSILEQQDRSANSPSLWRL